MADSQKARDWAGEDEVLNNPDALRRYIDDLTKLRDMPGKIYLDKLLRHRYDGIMAGLAGQRLQSLDESLGQEYDKGRAMECLYQRGLCETLIEYFKEHLEDLLANQGIEDE